MARFNEPEPEQEAGWKEWVAGRPPNVRAVAERFEPWSLYRMKDTGQRVTISSFGEGKDGKVSLTVDVRAQFNPGLDFERGVFGIDPDNLEPCDVPDPLGGPALMSLDTDLDKLRVQQRPDLWKMGPDGKAVRTKPH